MKSLAFSGFLVQGSMKLSQSLWLGRIFKSQYFSSATRTSKDDSQKGENAVKLLKQERLKAIYTLIEQTKKSKNN